jgi:hypothetical protein
MASNPTQKFLLTLVKLLSRPVLWNKGFLWLLKMLLNCSRLCGFLAWFGSLIIKFEYCTQETMKRNFQAKTPTNKIASRLHTKVHIGTLLSRKQVTTLLEAKMNKLEHTFTTRTCRMCLMDTILVQLLLSDMYTYSSEGW